MIAYSRENRLIYEIKIMHRKKIKYLLHPSP